MLNAIWVITRAQFLIARNSFWRGKIGRKIGTLALFALFAFAAYGINQLLRGAVVLITGPEFSEILEAAARETPNSGIPTDFRPFLDALPSLALFLALAILIITGFTSVLSSLYLSGDVDMLLVAPVPMRAVFIVKFFSGLITPYLILFFLLGPALVGYGQGLGYGPVFFIVLVLILALFPLLPTGIGALLVMAIVRVIPARRARDIVSVLGGMAGAAWYLFSQFSPQIAPRIATIETLDGLRQLDLPILPSAWAGRALVAAGRGEWLTLLAYGGLFSVLSICIFVLCLLLAERLYYIGWSNMATQGGRVRRQSAEQKANRSATSSSWFAALGSLLPRESAAILFKDLRVFPRDLRNLQQLIFPLALAGFWTFQLVTNTSTPGRRGSEVVETFGTAAPAAIAFFICLTLSNALGGPSISREGRGFWLLKLAPISGWRLLLGKLALAYLPFPVIGTLFIILLSILQGDGFLAFLRSLALLLVVGLGCCSIALGLGAAFPRFDWTDPRKQTTTLAGCLGPIMYMLYIALGLGAVLGLPALAAMFAPGISIIATIAGWAILAVLTAGVTWGSLAFGAARLERVEI